MATISLIAALDESRAIGKNNALIWHIPEDLQHFKTLTLHHSVIMGRKTHESIGRLLPNRVNIIVSRNSSYEVVGATVCHSLTEAIEFAKTKERLEIFIIGGAQLYAEAIGIADKLYLTLIEGKHDADAYFPDYSEFTNVLSQKDSSFGNYRFSFLELAR